MLRWILALPLIVVLVIFALSNRASVPVGFLGYEVITPISVAILLGAAVFFVLGGLVVWFGELRQRRRARRAERRVKELEAEIAALQARPAPVTILPASTTGTLVAAS